MMTLITVACSVRDSPLNRKLWFRNWGNQNPEYQFAARYSYQLTLDDESRPVEQVPM